MFDFFGSEYGAWWRTGGGGWMSDFKMFVWRNIYYIDPHYKKLEIFWQIKIQLTLKEFMKETSFLQDKICMSEVSNFHVNKQRQIRRASRIRKSKSDNRLLQHEKNMKWIEEQNSLDWQSYGYTGRTQQLVRAEESKCIIEQYTAEVNWVLDSYYNNITFLWETQRVSWRRFEDVCKMIEIICDRNFCF